jgi:hypothetical protein
MLETHLNSAKTSECAEIRYFALFWREQLCIRSNGGRTIFTSSTDQTKPNQHEVSGKQHNLQVKKVFSIIAFLFQLALLCLVAVVSAQYGGYGRRGGYGGLFIQ